MQLGIVTLFPEMFSAITDYGVTGRACRQKTVTVECWNPRDFTTDRHQTVDDRPYGGGAGMLMKTGPLREAIARARQQLDGPARVLYLSPQGRRLDHEGVMELARRPRMIIVCGRYQGIDERVIQTDIDEQWSVGDYVLSGGEPAAMVLLDALIRQRPGVLGHEQSAGLDSFAHGLLDCPRYTRPQYFAGEAVPPVLTGGDHEQIRQWRLKQSLGRTWLRRPDLFQGGELSREQRMLLDEFINEYRAAATRSS